MMQGDEYKLPLKLTMNGQPFGGAVNVEVMIGNIRKTLISGDIEYDSQTGQYMISVKQEETMRLAEETPVTVRVLLSDGDVLGADAGTLIVDRSLSKVVLKNA